MKRKIYIISILIFMSFINNLSALTCTKILRPDVNCVIACAIEERNQRNHLIHSLKGECKANVVGNKFFSVTCTVKNVPRNLRNLARDQDFICS